MYKQSAPYGMNALLNSHTIEVYVVDANCDATNVLHT